MNATADLRTLRLETYRSVVALAELHDLAPPVAVLMIGPDYVELRLDDDNRDGVTAWAAVLKLGAPLDRIIHKGGPNQFTAVRAERWDSNWLNWPHVVVLSYCDQRGDVQ